MADAAATAGAAGSGTRSGSKQSTNPADNYHLARRRTLQVVVSSLLTEAGFESAEKASVETLTEMLQSCFNVDTLPAYAKRSQRMVITAPPVTNQPVTPKALTAGQNRPHPPHIPSHFPEFPDPHTYIKTPTYREPVSDYQVLREKAASQRRDVERALTRFMAKTGETQSLFKDDVSTFPLIAARPFTIPYLTALLPSELEMQQMEETDSSEQDEQTDTENLPLHISPAEASDLWSLTPCPAQVYVPFRLLSLPSLGLVFCAPLCHLALPPSSDRSHCLASSGAERGPLAQLLISQ
ncbi:transcription initiation factor TFIID subunit 8 isoform X5 [Bubalus bubalis]|uniref:transcription initiation factor TFIID subunit 8 isoform X5 n=1 Tax=Bubalus bubalis TaxID=89462 RepID=UPI001E1B8EA4|nr:transcription initiation factor TFIID subunit 8 isoform X5 [Bubalus bubalis]